MRNTRRSGERASISRWRRRTHRGGVRGRPLGYVFEDTQSDPRQAVAVAQKFVGDPRILVELGDFSSAASMAASPIYQRGRLVQFGFTNSHPDFTKGGDYMWSNAPDQAEDMPNLARWAVGSLGMKRIAVVYIQGDWGRTSEKLFADAAGKAGAAVVASEGYLPNEQDFRSTLVRVREANPRFGGADRLLSRRRAGGAADADGWACGSRWSRRPRSTRRNSSRSAATRPRACTPTRISFPTILAPRCATSSPASAPNSAPIRTAITRAPTTRWWCAGRCSGSSARIARRCATDCRSWAACPSVVFGTAHFDPVTRRVHDPANAYLMVRGGKFVPWDRKAPGSV